LITKAVTEKPILNRVGNNKKTGYNMSKIKVNFAVYGVKRWK
jgi:hypothetical protein